MTVADGAFRSTAVKEIQIGPAKSLLPQLWSLSRPGMLLLSGWLGRRAVLLVPGVCAGALCEALLVAAVVFALYVAWERLGHRLSEPQGRIDS